MTILHTGSNPSRPSQRWTAPALPPHSPTTAPPSAHRSHCTEPVGIPTLLLQILPASTPHPQASRQPSDPPAKPPQIYYRAQHWTATREGGGTIRKCRICPALFSPSQPTHSPLLISHVLKNPVPDQFIFSLPPDAMQSQGHYHLLFFIIPVQVSVDPAFEWHCWMFPKMPF